MKSLFLLLFTAVCLVGLGIEPPNVEAARGPKGKNPDKLDNPKPEVIFNFLDKDDDKALTLKELKDGKTGAEAAEVQARFKKWDTDGNGKLTLDEYKAGVAATPIPKREPAKKKPPVKKVPKRK